MACDVGKARANGLELTRELRMTTSTCRGCMNSSPLHSNFIRECANGTTNTAV